MISQRLASTLAIASFLTALLGVWEQSFAAESRRVDAASGSSATEKTAVLIVSHGSHSPVWRKMLDEFRGDVEPALLELPGISGVKSAFMEYSEPSIATSFKEFDDEGYDNVVLIPLLLTVSSHSFDDIPTIIGAKEDAKSLMMMEAEGIERYVPKAKVMIAPLLDFSTLLEHNLPRRIKTLSKEPSREGVVLVAYGDETYNDEWETFFQQIGRAIQAETGVADIVHCWCGHVVKYSKEPTKNAIDRILKQHERAIVIPVLVARDRYFQDALIGGAIEELDLGDRIAYTPDAILPDPALNEWVVSIARQTHDKYQSRQSRQGGKSP